MPKKPAKHMNYNEEITYNDDEIEDSFIISQNQLTNAKLFSSREEYAKNFKKKISYLEVGVAWGYSAQMFIDYAEADSADLLDWYNQDLKCWSWRKFGSCQCTGFKHEILYTPETHEQYIKDKFSYHKNIKTIKGDALDLLPTLNKKYDLIYIDITNERITTRKVLSYCSNLVDIGGIIGLNDYLIYDGIIEDAPYGTFQTVNEFLELNKNWVVDAIALHNLGFYDIYIRRES
jgi:hypothetical protein